MPGGERIELDHHQLWRPAVLPRWPLLRHRQRTGRRFRQDGHRARSAAGSRQVRGPDDPGGVPGLRQPLPQEALRPGQLLQGRGLKRLALQQPEPDPRRRGAGDGRGGVELHLRRAVRVRRAGPGHRRLRGALRGGRRLLRAGWPSLPAISRWRRSSSPWYPAPGPSPFWRSSSRASSTASRPNRSSP